MKTKLLFVNLLCCFSLLGYGTTWTVSNSGSTFTPATITIALGDSVNFTLTSTHNAREVNQATWNANGTTALNGGFQTNFGGGLVLPSKLGVGTHYYVCSNHASMGMKGTIIVQNSSGVTESILPPAVSFYPNPSNGNFKLEVSEVLLGNQAKLEVYSLTGKLVHAQAITEKKSSIWLNDPISGIYFIVVTNDEAVLTKKLIIK